MIVRGDPRGADPWGDLLRPEGFGQYRCQVLRVDTEPALAGGNGGLGGVQNTVIGVLVVVALANGMVLMGVPPYVQTGVQGLLIIAAVALSLDRSRIRIVK